MRAEAPVPGVTQETRKDLERRLVDFAHLAGVGPDAVSSEVVTLAGDASTRRYHRVLMAGGASTVVMELPPDAVGSTTEADFPFLNVQRFLAARGYPVPQVLRANLPGRLIALEDLGDRTFERALGETSPQGRRRLYERAIELIVRLQELGRTPDPTCVAFGRGFDFKLLRWELDHFREWLLEAYLGERLDERERTALDRTFDWVATTLAESPQVLAHRDFQSRNLMVLPSEGAVEEAPIVVIDFQDALLGSRAYDLVALLRDSYVVLEPAEVEALLGRYIERARIEDPAAFRKLFYLQTVQRKLKDAGRFVFIDRVRGNPSFLRRIPASLAYVRDALPRVPELEPAREVLARHVPALR